MPRPTSFIGSCSLVRLNAVRKALLILPKQERMFFFVETSVGVWIEFTPSVQVSDNVARSS